MRPNHMPMHEWFDSIGVVAIQVFIASVGATFSGWAFVDARRDLRYAHCRLQDIKGLNPSTDVPFLIALSHVKRERFTTIAQGLLLLNAVGSWVIPLPDLPEMYHIAEDRILINRIILSLVTILLAWKSIRSRWDRHALLSAMETASELKNETDETTRKAQAEISLSYQELHKKIDNNTELTKQAATASAEAAEVANSMNAKILETNKRISDTQNTEAVGVKEIHTHIDQAIEVGRETLDTAKDVDHKVDKLIPKDK